MCGIAGRILGAPGKWGDLVDLMEAKSIAVQIVQGLPFTNSRERICLRGMGFDKSRIDCDIENLLTQLIMVATSADPQVISDHNKHYCFRME